MRQWLNGFMLGLGLIAAGGAKEEPCRVQWLTESATVQAGGVLKTAMRVELKPGWHVYWINPGAAGVPLEAVWALPEGWVAEGPVHLEPIRFQTGGLHGFGYEGEAWYPVTLRVPAGFGSAQVLRGKITWLACNEGACVPGEAEVELRVGSGAPVATPEAEMVRAAHERQPVPAPEGVKCEVLDRGKSLEINVSGIPVGVEKPILWPATPDWVDPKARMVLEPKAGGGWAVEVPKGEYASGPVPELTFWLTSAKSKVPWVLRAKAVTP